MMLDKNYAEKVPTDGTSDISWYIPHHAVFNTNKSPNVRVVFDCSARFHDISLNECLLQGPDLLNALIVVLCKFREDQVAFMADVEKMFYRFKVKKEHRDYLRFLWWEDGDMTSKPTAYRMTVHIFGATSSPGCANFALKSLANSSRNAYSNDTIDFLLNSFYVDDGLYSAKTVEDAWMVVNESITLCSSRNLRLHKFVSNNRNLLNKIPESERLPIERAL